MLWCGECDSIEEYYNKCVGVPLQLLPTVLGLKLAVDLELGSKYAKLMKWIKHNIQMQSAVLVMRSRLLQVIAGLVWPWQLRNHPLKHFRHNIWSFEFLSTVGWGRQGGGRGIELERLSPNPGKYFLVSNIIPFHITPMRFSSICSFQYPNKRMIAMIFCHAEY